MHVVTSGRSPPCCDVNAGSVDCIDGGGDGG